MNADYEWGWMPGLHMDFMILEQERKAKEAQKKANEEKQKLKNEEGKSETTKKKNEEENKAVTEETEFNQNRNALDALVDFVKHDFLEDRSTSKPYISIEDYAKSKNREGLNSTQNTSTLTFAPYSDLSGPSESTFGTRNFLPPLMASVAFFSLAMILFTLCRWELYRRWRRKRESHVSTMKPSSPEDGCELEESCKLNTFEPSAPVELELVEGGGNSTKTTLVPRAEDSRTAENTRAIADFRLRYQMAESAKKKANSLALLPLLEHVFGRTNECENCRHPFSSQRCHLGGNHRI